MEDDEDKISIEDSIEMSIDCDDCLACTHYMDKTKAVCDTCDSDHCSFKADTDLQIMKNITNFNEGY